MNKENEELSQEANTEYQREAQKKILFTIDIGGALYTCHITWVWSMRG